MASGTPKKRTLKRASKSAKTNASVKRKDNAKANDIERRKIERLLGEEFDNVTRARRALKKETVPATKAEIKKLGKKESVVLEPRRRKIADKQSYTLRELTGHERKTFQQYVLDINKDAKLLEKEITLKQGELFAVTFTGKDGRLTRTLQLYTSIPRLMQTVGTYFTVTTGQALSNLVSNLRVIKFKQGETNRDTATAWREEVRGVREERRVDKLAVKREASKVRREARKVPTLQRKLDEAKQKERKLREKLKNKGKKK